MILNIDEISPEGKQVSLELDKNSFIDRLSLDGGLLSGTTSLKSVPTAEIKAEINGLTVILTGKAQLAAESVCSRCSEPAEIILDKKISMVLKPKRENQDSIEDLDLGFYQGKEINLAPIIEEHLILSLPFKLLCKPDCKGLCIQCGENLNFGKCLCDSLIEASEGRAGTFMPFAELKGKIKL